MFWARYDGGGTERDPATIGRSESEGRPYHTFFAQPATSFVSVVTIVFSPREMGSGPVLTDSISRRALARGS